MTPGTVDSLHFQVKRVTVLIPINSFWLWETRHSISPVATVAAEMLEAGSGLDSASTCWTEGEWLQPCPFVFLAITLPSLYISWARRTWRNLCPSLGHWLGWHPAFSNWENPSYLFRSTPKSFHWRPILFSGDAIFHNLVPHLLGISNLRIKFPTLVIVEKESWSYETFGRKNNFPSSVLWHSFNFFFVFL